MNQMPNLNKCCFMGNLTREPEVRYMTSGEAVTNCSIAINESWKGKDGTKQERTEFVNLVFYRRLAEIAGEYLKKGAPVYVEGKLQTRKWQDKEGKDRYSTEIVVNEMQMLGSKPEGQQVGKTEKPRQQSNGDGFDSDIPFMRAGIGGLWRVC